MRLLSGAQLVTGSLSFPQYCQQPQGFRHKVKSKFRPTPKMPPCFQALMARPMGEEKQGCREGGDIRAQLAVVWDPLQTLWKLG